MAKRKPAGKLKIVISEPPGGYDPGRLSRALSMLISEKDFIDYFRRQAPHSTSQPDPAPCISSSAAPNRGILHSETSISYPYEQNCNLRPRVNG